MATLQIEEVGVRARITIKRGPDGVVQVWAEGQSLDAAGNVARATRDLDITENVSQGVRDGAESLMTNIENRLKNQWNIA